MDDALALKKGKEVTVEGFVLILVVMDDALAQTLKRVSLFFCWS